MSDSQYDLRLWLNEQVKLGGRGVKGRLAEHMGLRSDALSRILNLDPNKESRQLKAHEIEAAREFFGFPPLQVSKQVPLISFVSAGALANPDFVADEFDPIRYVSGYDLDPNGDWIALRVDGRSMDKISPQDSIIFVNRKEKTLVPNALYIIGDGNGGATYKRFKPPNFFEPVSTKKDEYETIEFDQKPDIIGRVRKTILDL